MQVDNCTQWRTQDFFKGGGVSNIALHAMIDVTPGLKKLMSFPSSKYLGKFSRNGVGVSIVHHQLSDKHRSSDPKGPEGGGGFTPQNNPTPPKKNDRGGGGGGLNPQPPHTRLTAHYSYLK